jgi:hypothetical protein
LGKPAIHPSGGGTAMIIVKDILDQKGHKAWTLGP